MANQEFGALLVLANFPDGDCSRAVAACLESAGTRSRFSCSLGGELFSLGVFSGGLFGACHLLEILAKVL